jgi:multicomponent K+:H+ antiporter subunit A
VYGLGLWHGLHLPQLMSLVALVGGTARYAARRYLFDLHGYSSRELTGQVVVERLIGAMIRAARALLPRLESHSLQRYTLLLVLAALALGCAGAGRTALTGGLPRTPLDPLTAALSAVLIAAALATARLHRRRLEALICNAVVGLVVTLAFVRFSAPDVALAQLLVEIVTMILMLLVMFYLPQRSPRDSSTPRRSRDIVVAAAAGAAMAALAWMILTRPHSSVSSFYLRHALTAGGGANVVNVILVDFRAFDTLGEITVLSIAAAAIVALLAGLRPPFPANDWLGVAWTRDRHPLMLSVVARPLLPLALLVSVYLFLRGHNAPGGGFIAGLAAGTAIVLQYMALGVRRTRALLPANYTWLLGAGLGIAALTGIASLAFGSPFLTSTLGRVRLPLAGAFELASALAFDLGVFLVVVGTVLGTLATLGQVVVREEGE